MSSVGKRYINHALYYGFKYRLPALLVIREKPNRNSIVVCCVTDVNRYEVLSENIDFYAAQTSATVGIFNFAVKTFDGYRAAADSSARNKSFRVAFFTELNYKRKFVIFAL